MKQEHSFSLVYCPWIYVTDKTYKTNYVGLKQLFEEAEDCISITSENELITLSIHMLVFSIIFTVCSRNESLYALSTHSFDYKKVKPYILSYLNTNANKFNLYDKEYPFLQLTKDNKNFKSVKPNSIQALSITDQSNNKENKYSIDKINKNDIDGWIARHFISFRYFHCHVNKQKPDINTHVFDCLVSKTLNSENKEITKKYFPCFYKGESLSQTFKLNFLNTWYDNCSPDNRVTLLPDWEYDYSDFDKEKAYKETKENKNLNKNLTIKIPDYDIARFYTYSNIHLSIDRENLSFTMIYNHSLDDSKFKYKDIALLINDKQVLHVIEENSSKYSLKWIDDLCLSRRFLNSICGIIAFPEIVYADCKTKVKQIKHRNLMCEQLLQVLDSTAKGINARALESFIKMFNNFKLSELIKINQNVLDYYYTKKYADKNVKTKNKQCYSSDKKDILENEFIKKAENVICFYFNEFCENKEKAYNNCIYSLYKLCLKQSINLINESKHPWRIMNNISAIFNTDEKAIYFSRIMENKMKRKELMYQEYDAYKLFKYRSSLVTDNIWKSDKVLMNKYINRENLNVADISSLNLSSRYKKDKQYKQCVDSAVRDALFLWASYQKNIWKTNQNKYADSISGTDYYYKQSLGYILYNEYCILANDDKEKFLNKYEQKCKAGFNDLLKYMSIILKRTNITQSVSFGKLACLFEEYYKNSDMTPLYKDIRDSFEISCLK